MSVTMHLYFKPSLGYIHSVSVVQDNLHLTNDSDSSVSWRKNPGHNWNEARSQDCLETKDKSGFNDRDTDQITTVFSSSLLLNSLIMRLLPSYTLVTETWSLPDTYNISLSWFLLVKNDWSVITLRWVSSLMDFSRISVNQECGSKEADKGPSALLLDARMWRSKASGSSSKEW